MVLSCEIMSSLRDLNLCLASWLESFRPFGIINHLYQNVILSEESLPRRARLFGRYRSLRVTQLGFQFTPAAVDTG